MTITLSQKNRPANRSSVKLRIEAETDREERDLTKLVQASIPIMRNVSDVQTFIAKLGKLGYRGELIPSRARNTKRFKVMRSKP